MTDKIREAARELAAAQHGYSWRLYTFGPNAPATQVSHARLVAAGDAVRAALAKKDAKP